MGARRPAYTVNNRLRGGGRQGTQAIRAISGSDLQGLCGRKIGEAGKERQGRFWEKKRRKDGFQGKPSKAPADAGKEQREERRGWGDEWEPAWNGVGRLQRCKSGCRRGRG